MKNKFYTNSTYGDLLFVVQKRGYGKTYFEKERNKRMSVKLYKEILEYIEYTKSYIKSIDNEKVNEITFEDIKNDLLYNLDSLEESINKIIEK